ncbi:membrane protein insertase YidC [Paenibacillus sp. CAU 1782]
MPDKKQFPRRSARSRIYAFALLGLGLLTLTGCGSATGTINESTPGTFNHYVIYPLSQAIQWLASQFHDNYGFAIMAITIIIRVVLFPLMLRQYRSQRDMKQKMAILQPELKVLEEKYKGKTKPEDAKEKQQEMMALYSKHKVNPLAIGCLPMLIQLPILTGLYSAIRLTPDIASHSFLWFKLGETDMLLPIIAAVIYFIQFKVSQIGNDSPQNKQLAFMGYLSPIMMGAFALFAPAAISLYWVTGGLFMIAQAFLLSKIYPMAKKEIVPEGSKATG